MIPSVSLSRDARVAILGAGASGLAVAHALVRAGFRNVTVIDRSDRVGGKCCTFHHRGRSYELGAGAITSGYTHVHKLMDRVGVVSIPGKGGLFVDLETGRDSFVPPALRGGSWWKLPSIGVRFGAAVMFERRIRKPGFAGIDPKLCMPFTEWARARKLGDLVELIAPWFTGFGYGYLDEVPAAYVLKYAPLFRFPIHELLDEGYQGLWEKVARGLDVRLGVTVRAIRRGETISLDTSAGPLEHDALVLACPLDDALPALDATDEERALFSQIQYNPYHVVAVEMERAPRARYGFIARHLDRAHAGEVMFWYRRWMENELVLFYTLPAPGMTLGDTTAIVERTVGKMGGRVREVLRTHEWRYFPHVGPDEMRGGFYDRLEALQGQRRTWMCGEIFNFSTVETVVAYAEDLVQRRLVG
jgi:predicted NAD/FAD-binding protein